MGAAFRHAPQPHLERRSPFSTPFLGEKGEVLSAQSSLLSFMPGTQTENSKMEPWSPTPDTKENFSSGILDLDRLLGGGYRRGSMALFQVDETIEPSDLELLFTPTLLNFLYQSNGVIAVLPSRMSPHEFRTHLSRWVTRRRFDTRVRIISYVGEDTEAPYVVDLRGVAGGSDKDTKAARAKVAKAMERMSAAERAARGARNRMFLEVVSFEIAEMMVGPQTASRMFFHGIKRVRGVGNLCIGILRPGLGCADAVRGMADIELALHHGELGLVVRGIRPRFPDRLVIPDAQRNEPYVTLLPA